MAGYVGFISQLTRGIDPMTNVGRLSAVLAQHYADSMQRLVFAIRAVWCCPIKEYRNFLGPM